MPALFVGHGSPMNAIEDNQFSRGWKEAAHAFPRPNAILCIPAHCETWGTLLTGMPKPRTIHDFGGFPRALFEVKYPAHGDQRLSEELRAIIHSTTVEQDQDWTTAVGVC